MQPGEEIENLVAELEDTINTAKPAFGGGGQRKIVNAEDVYQIVVDIRAVFPEEFATARRIIKEQQEILAHAQTQADSIIADAQQQAMILAGDQEIVRLAQKNAEDIRDAAQQYERDTRYSAEEYAEDVLARLEDNLKSIVGQVTRCRQSIAENASARTGQQQNW